MRNRILMAAAEEMNSRGTKFTMSDLARRLSISKTSLYEHFSSKNELIHNILTTATNDVQNQEEEIYNSSELSIAEKIPALLKVAPKVFGPINNHRLFDELQHYYPDEYQIVKNFREQQLNHLLSLIVQGIETDAVRPINMNVLRLVVVSAMNDLFTYRFLSESNMTFPDALTALSDLLVFGLLPRNP